MQQNVFQKEKKVTFLVCRIIFKGQIYHKSSGLKYRPTLYFCVGWPLAMLTWCTGKDEYDFSGIRDAYCAVQAVSSQWSWTGPVRLLKCSKWTGLFAWSQRLFPADKFDCSLLVNSKALKGNRCGLLLRC